MQTKLFYPTMNHEGKWHTCDKVTGVATCHPQLVDRSVGAIHVQPNQDKVHPMLCKRCLLEGGNNV